MRFYFGGHTVKPAPKPYHSLEEIRDMADNRWALDDAAREARDKHRDAAKARGENVTSYGCSGYRDVPGWLYYYEAADTSTTEA